MIRKHFNSKSCYVPNLKRLKALGDFRNSYIINNQNIILDEKRPLPLDLGYKILEEIYKFADKQIPEWLKLRLPENQLEESIEDNSVIVKRAFEKYIGQQVNNRSIQIWRLKEGDHIQLPEETSERLCKLAESNLLPDVKMTRNYEVIIRKGILTELYNNGVSSDQLPNLRALADDMKADYRKNHGNWVVAADKAKLNAYFDRIEE